MKDARFQEKINEILKAAEAAPSDQKEKIFLLANKSKEDHKNLTKKIDTLQQSLDYLRLSVKYLIFDLEATRRENTDLRKQLEDSRPQ